MGGGDRHPVGRSQPRKNLAYMAIPATTCVSPRRRLSTDPRAPPHRASFGGAITATRWGSSAWNRSRISTSRLARCGGAAKPSKPSPNHRVQVESAHVRREHCTDRLRVHGQGPQQRMAAGVVVLLAASDAAPEGDLRAHPGLDGGRGARLRQPGGHAAGRPADSARDLPVVRRGLRPVSRRPRGPWRSG